MIDTNSIESVSKIFEQAIQIQAKQKSVVKPEPEIQAKANNKTTVT